MSATKEVLFPLKYKRSDIFALVPGYKFVSMYTLVFYVIVLCFAVSPGKGNPVNWQVSIRVGSTGQYERPGNKNPDDYVQYQELKTIVQEILENKRRISYVNENLLVNGHWDTAMKCFAALATCCGILYGIYAKYKNVKKISEENRLALNQNEMIRVADPFGKAIF